MPAEYDLNAAVKRIKTKPFNFALIKGSETNQVYISPKPPNSKQLGPIMDECGEGKRIAKGLCMWENDQLTFATKAAPSGSWEKMTTKIFKENQCAKYLPVVFRQLGEDESDEVSTEEGELEGEAEPGSAAPPATGLDSKQLLAALNKMAPLIKQAVADHPERKEEILRPVVAFQAHIKANELPRAREALLRAGALLKMLKGEPATEGKTGTGGPAEWIEPSTRLRSALRAAALRTPVAEDDDELQDNLAALAPAFLAAAMDEPEMSASPLTPGAPIPEQDRMTDIAGLLDSLGRKLEQWDVAIDEAEASKSSLSGSEPGAESDAATHESYDESRARGQSLMGEVQGLMETIREQCGTFENASRGASP